MRPVVSLVPTTFQQIESCERSCRRTAHLYPAGKQEAKRAGPKVAVDKHGFSCFFCETARNLPPPAASPVYCCRGSSPPCLSVAGWSMHPVVSLVPTTCQQTEPCARSRRLTTHLHPAGKQEAKRAGAKVAVDKHDFSCFAAKLPEIWPRCLPCTAVVELHLLFYQLLAGVCIPLFPWCLQHFNQKTKWAGAKIAVD